MKFIELDLPGVWVLEPELVADDRGVFHRSFCQREFQEHGLAPELRQGNVSSNKRKHTLRGFHYQIQPHEEAKTLSCLVGSIYDIVVDLRPDSPTFLKWVSVNLNAADGLSLHVPAGCANAYMSMDETTLVHYYMSEFYAPDSYRGFRYDDPLFGFEWPCEPAVISDKDRSFPDFDPESLKA